MLSRVAEVQSLQLEIYGQIFFLSLRNEANDSDVYGNGGFYVNGRLETYPYYYWGFGHNYSCPLVSIEYFNSEGAHPISYYQIRIRNILGIGGNITINIAASFGITDISVMLPDCLPFKGM